MTFSILQQFNRKDILKRKIQVKKVLDEIIRKEPLDLAYKTVTLVSLFHKYLVMQNFCIYYYYFTWKGFTQATFQSIWNHFLQKTKILKVQDVKIVYLFVFKHCKFFIEVLQCNLFATFLFFAMSKKRSVFFKECGQSNK